MSGIAERSAQKFSMKGLPVLSDGLDSSMLAIADQLWVESRVYATGGENTLHRHSREDHTFFVLAGKAAFYDKDDKETIVGQFDGIMIPRGVFYRFRCASEENLVILRVGAGESFYRSWNQRESDDGAPVRSAGPAVPVPDRYFGVPKA